MLKYFRLGCGLLFLSGLTACSSFSQLSQTHPVQPEPQILNIANPIVDTVQHQVAIRRISDILTQEQLNDEQQAELYFRRGLLLDELGLMHLAYFDMMQALEHKPDLSEAYNMLGIYYVRQEEFGRAYESFDSVLELTPDHEYAYFNRAIALYYGERAQLSYKDFESFYNINPTDPYRVIWWYFAEYQESPEMALSRLKQRAGKLDKNAWGYKIIQLFTGEIQALELQQLAAKLSHDEQGLNEKLCEAYFYIAKNYQMSNFNEAAEYYFKAALSTHIYQFVEFRYAQTELKRMAAWQQPAS
ncbi:lipoprotein NlpI [Catenovulum sediminis]|uniref:Lipoprotein NlpI n=1 Tax=Catenovulum sediminis TaxID=1740262 RepID=A0ABV1RH61_9ALTE